MTHPARTIPYADLYAGLTQALIAGQVSVTRSGPLELYTYTKSCVYENGWNQFTELARGLVLDAEAGTVVATSFKKFWNLGERPHLPALPFETFEKVDGSLIIVFHHAGEWRTATKGSFGSEQAQWAYAWLGARNFRGLIPGNTYLFEAVYPENRIVIKYPHSGLIYLGGYDAAGREFNLIDQIEIQHGLQCMAAQRHQFDCIADLIATTGTLPGTSEGFVVRFSNGYRVKVKGDEYCRLHRCISNVTPLAIWEAMRDGKADEMRKELPEEFWVDFDSIRNEIRLQRDMLCNLADGYANTTAHMTDKELGLRLGDIPDRTRPFVFPIRKGQDISARLLRAVRPTGNRLDGYVPSSSMNRVFQEAA